MHTIGLRRRSSILRIRATGRGGDSGGGGGGRRGIGSVARVRHRCLLRLESEQWYPPNIQRNREYA